jgi:hypothetical protein
VSYSIDVDPIAQDVIGAMPTDALSALREAFTVLQTVPWNGTPQNPDNPEGPVRNLAFGSAGLLTYLILEDEQRVDVLLVAWAT